MIRQRLEQVTEYNETDMQQTIYNNVRKWQDALEPVLAEDSKRKEFNFGRYGEEMLAFLEKLGKEEVTFAELSEGVPRWEADRLFLTVLVLANTENVEITKEGTDSRQWTVRLLSAVPNRPALLNAGEAPREEKEKGEEEK